MVAERARGGRWVAAVRGIAGAADAVAGALLIALMLAVVAMILGRNLLDLGLAWLDDAVRYVQIWVVYLGAVAVTLAGGHIAVDSVPAALPAPLRRGLALAWAGLGLATCAVVAVLSLRHALWLARIGEASATGAIPAWLGFAALPLGFVLMTLASAERLRRILAREAEADGAGERTRRA